jgi:hypothetical protein
MKTPEEMAKEFSEKFKLNEYSQYELKKLLDEMELQTRHACAEKVSESAISPCEHNSKIRVIDADEAYTAIINKTV